MKRETLILCLSLLFWSGSTIVLAEDVSRGLEAANRGDYETALSIVLPAAEAGDAIAQNAMGVFFGTGRGVSLDYSEALRWYELSAAQGYASAQYNIGTFFQFGRGVQVDFERAAFWYKQAANQRHPHALFHLGLLYADGVGVEQDLIRAYFCLELALELGHPQAEEVMKLILADLAEQDLLLTLRSAENLPIKVQLPPECELIRSGPDSWVCDYGSINGRDRRLLIDFQTIELGQDGRETLSNLDDAELEAVLNNEITKIDQRREAEMPSGYARVRYEFLEAGSRPDGFISCVVSRDEVMFEGADARNDRASLHCWSANRNTEEMYQLLISLIEFTDPRQEATATLVAEFDEIVESVELE